MSLPFYLTFLRVIMSPLFLAIYLYGTSWGISISTIPYALLGIMLICELSDIFDGFVARRHNKVTDLGKVLDPMADSFFRLTVFLTFTQGIVQLPLLLVLVFFLRDAIVNALRTLCALQGVALAARLSGKVKAIVQAATAFLILILMIPYTLGCLDFESFYAMCFYATAVTALYTVISGGEYMVANWHQIRKAFSRT